MSSLLLVIGNTKEWEESVRNQSKYLLKQEKRVVDIHCLSRRRGGTNGQRTVVLDDIQSFRVKKAIIEGVFDMNKTAKYDI